MPNRSKESGITDAIEQRAPIPWGAKRLRLAVEAAGIALWSWNVDNGLFEMDDHAFDLWGVPPSGAMTFEDLSIHIHPEDRDRVRAAFAATRGVLRPYEIDFRVVNGADVRRIPTVSIYPRT